MRPLVSLLTLLSVLAPGRAEACSCAAVTLEDAIAGADAIFEGVVDSIDEAGGTRRVRFAVTQAWRGVSTERVEVVTPSSEASCGYPFEVGIAYLVYAEDRGERSVSLCSRTRPMDAADEDRRALGSGVVPIDVVDEPVEPIRPPRTPPSRAGCASCGVAAPRAPSPLFGIFVLALVARLRRA